MKHKTVRVLAASVLPRPEEPPGPDDELAEAWKEVLQLPQPAHWIFNDYMATMLDLGTTVDATLLRRMVATARSRYEERCRAEGHRPVPDTPPRPPRGRHEPVVYYFRFGDLVKIGTSADVARRRQQVPCQGVMALEWGDRAVEQQRHREFVDSHQWGEWFHLDERVGPHIVAVRQRFEANVAMSTEDWLHLHR